MTYAPALPAVLAASLGAALLFAVSSVAKHASAGDGPPLPGPRSRELGRFAVATVRHPLWLAALLADAGGAVLQVIALHVGSLAVVQPLMLSGLVFALLLRAALDRRLPRVQLGWAVLVSAALAGLLALTGARAAAGPLAVDRLPAGVLAAIGAAVVVAAVVLGTRARRPGTRAALLGFAAGTVYASTAALVKLVGDTASRGVVALLLDWQLYAVVALALTGLLLGQLSFRAGPLSAGLPVAAAVDPLLSVVIGFAIFDERLRAGPADGSVLVLLLAVLALAVVQLARRDERAESVSGHDLGEPLRAEHAAEQRQG